MLRPRTLKKLLAGLLLPLLVVVLARLGLTDASEGLAATAAVAEAGAVAEVAVEDLPAQARRTLVLIRKGGPFPYGKDGSTFGNRERLLPPKRHGYYTEYTVPTPSSPDRGARRIVAGGDPSSSDDLYYTDDHYGSFRKIREPIQ